MKGGLLLIIKELSKELVDFPQNELPRERALNEGVKSLATYELLAVVLRTGGKEKNVIELAIQIMQNFPTLYDLKKATVEELLEIKGIGKVKAIEIKCVLELGERLAESKIEKTGKVSSSEGIGKKLIHEMKDLHQEKLVALYLNTNNEIIKQETVFIGSLNQSVAHPREIYRLAVRYSAAHLILAHNHPSGNLTPSENDKVFTKRVKESGDIIGIPLLDHLIIGTDAYYSFREMGEF